MKHHKNCHVGVLGLLLCAAVLTACSLGQYRDDVETDLLARRCAEAVGMQDAEYGTWEDWAEGRQSDGEPPDVTVCRSGDSGNLDEFGIWRTSRGDAGKMASLIGDYLKQSYEDNRAYYESYLPLETPKLRDAEVRIVGTYVAYAVLEPEKRALFFHTVEEELRE